MRVIHRKRPDSLSTTGWEIIIELWDHNHLRRTLILSNYEAKQLIRALQAEVRP